LYIRKIIYFLGFFSSMFFVGEEEMTVSQTMQNSKVLSMDVAGNSFFTPPFPDCISTKRPTLRFLNFSFLWSYRWTSTCCSSIPNIHQYQHNIFFFSVFFAEYPASRSAT
jgi:hypothetical protein